MRFASSFDRAVRILLPILLLLACAADAFAADVYNGATLTIPSVTIGGATYSNMVVTVGGIVSGPVGSAPYTSVDSYNPANGELTVPAVTLGGATYYNVVVIVNTLVSVGSVTGADSYAGGTLSIPAVLVGDAAYTAQITVGGIVGVSGGMPGATLDNYDFATGVLSIPAVEFGGSVYTNVSVTVGTIKYASAIGGTATPSVASGEGHSCALSHAGLVFCWGANVDGQLGNGGTTRSNVPVAVIGLPPDVVAIAAGQYHNCALTRLGAVLCWGYNANGELGNGQSETQSSTPVPVTGLSGGAVAISAGGYDTCVVTTTGAGLCWGAASGATVPTQPSGLTSPLVSIAAGSYHFCAVTSAGADLCWGLTSNGELGNPNATSTITPYPVLDPAGTANLPAVAAFSSGYGNTCARNADGTMLCWGAGPVGDGTTNSYDLPVQVLAAAGTPLSGVTAIATGNSNACALTAGGAMLCWGLNSWGQLGTGSYQETEFPTPVKGLSSGVTVISMGEDHSCAVTAPGAVWCWGLIALGNGTTNGSDAPVQVFGVGGTGLLQL